MGEVCLDDGNYGEMAFRARPTHQNQLPDSCRGETCPMAARFGYNGHGCESYLGNVGLILFRRIARNTFELRVHPWDSDAARAYVEASRRAGLVFRVGRNSNRLAGFVP